MQQAAVAEACRQSCQGILDSPHSPGDEFYVGELHVVLGKIDAGLELGNHVDQRFLHRTHLVCQRAVHLVHRGPRLDIGLGVD